MSDQPEKAGHTAVRFTAPWSWDDSGSLRSADGLHVIYAYATAECGRKGDYYECGSSVSACAVLKVPPELRPILSAAPDMLAALKAMILNDPHTYRDCHKAALAAIAKAESR